jgi:predicted GIY-YIG superfamily endonuclease
MTVKKRIPLKNAAIEDPEELDHEPVEDDDEGSQIRPNLVGTFIRMWPRAIFTTRLDSKGEPIFTTRLDSKGEGGKRPLLARTIPALKRPGVYILYRDDVPFYVGQTKGELFSRLWAHANGVGSRGYFWNYFSAFLVENTTHIDEVEAILISAMPSVITNGAKPKLPKEKMGMATRKVIRDLRERGLY